MPRSASACATTSSSSTSAIEVRDDSIVASADEVAREQDHVAVSIDARPDPERSSNEETFVAIRSGAMAKLVSPLIALQETRPDPVVRALRGRRAGGRRERRAPHGDGLCRRGRRAGADLDERRGGRWDALRVNVTVSDFDEGESDHVDLAWRPSRFEAGAIEGAGTFVRRSERRAPAYSPRYVRGIVALLMAAVAVEFLHRQLLAIAVEPIRAELGFSDTQMGALVTGFAVSYAAFVLVLGRLADAGSRRTIYALCIAVWSVGTALGGAVSGFAAFFATRLRGRPRAGGCRRDERAAGGRLHPARSAAPPRSASSRWVP